jgi:hypothetical protein
MKILSEIRKPAISAIVFFVTLMGLSATYAAFTSLLNVGNGDQLKSTDWNAMIANLSDLNGRTVPTGAVMPFNLATCPTGWTEYTPARGRFIRGIDNGAGNDPSGTRALENVQADSFQGHHHSITFSVDSTGLPNIWPYMSNGYSSSAENSTSEGATSPVTDGTNGNPRTANETRPKNVALLYCVKN